MESPHRIPAAAAGSGNKENISENEAAILGLPPLQKDVAFSAKPRKKPSGFSLRKSIAWNPAFFTEEGVLDNSELSMLTGSELMAKGSPSSGINGIMSPLCRSRNHVLKQAAQKSPAKLSAQSSRAENQGGRLFSSAKTPQRDRKEPAVTQNTSSTRIFQKIIPRVPTGSAQKKLSNSASTALTPRIPKKPLSSLPMALKSSTGTTSVSKSNKKLPPVKAEHIHRVPGLLPKSKIDSGPSMETDVVPAAAAAIHKETSGSVKLKNPQISPSSFGGSTSTIPKPSALRKPSPSVGFFNQENAQTSHGNTVERYVGKFYARSTPSLVKPPRYKLPEDLGLHLPKVLPTKGITSSNVVSLPGATDSNTDTLVTSEKRSLSKIISTYSVKSRDANYKERLEVYCSLAGNGDTTQPLSAQKNDGVRNSVPIVYKGTSHVEGRSIIKETEPVENSLSSKATCFLATEATCPSFRGSIGATDSGSIGATDIGERELPVSLSEGGSCTLDIGASQNSDSCDHHITECATLMESGEYTLYVDQMPPSSSSSHGKPAIDDRNSVLNDPLYYEGKSALSEEPNSDGGTDLETKKAPAVTEDPLFRVGFERNHNFKRTKCSPLKLEAPMAVGERQNVSSVEVNMEEKMEFGSNKLPAQEGASQTEKDRAVDRPRTNSILREHLKNLVPFTEEWLAVMEACGQDVLEQKSGAVQNSPPDKTAPEPSPWSPVKRKAQDVGPFDCTKYSKSVRTSGTP